MKNLMSSISILLTICLIITFSIAHAEISKNKQIELEKSMLYDCAFCHGFDLEGSDKAPPLMPYNLRALPDDFIVSIIRRGRPGTKMPSWVKNLSEEEVYWMVRWLKAGKRLETKSVKPVFEMIY